MRLRARMRLHRRDCGTKLGMTETQRSQHARLRSAPQLGRRRWHDAYRRIVPHRLRHRRVSSIPGMFRLSFF